MAGKGLRLQTAGVAFFAAEPDPGDLILFFQQSPVPDGNRKEETDHLPGPIAAGETVRCSVLLR